MKKIIIRGDWIEGFDSKLAVMKEKETEKTKVYRVIGLTMGTSVEHCMFYHILNYNYSSKREVKDAIRDQIVYYETQVI